jgi:two-component sensor histidine kinase
MKKHAIKIRILIPLIVSLTALLIGFVVDIYQSKQKDIALELEKKMKAVPDVLETELKDDAYMIMAVIRTLNENTHLKPAFRARDRNKLLTLTEPLFDRLRSDHRITHFYFTDPQRINLLRVHKPEKYGDLIDRHTMLAAERTGKTSYGIELGPLGTFTLRVVQPFYDDQGLIGYLELGEEIDHLIHKVRKITDTELLIVINKKNLNREDWESGMKMLGRNAYWNQLPYRVITAQTLEKIPDGILDDIVKEGHKHDTSFIVETPMKDKRSLRYVLTPLFDVSRTEVGDIVIMMDVTESIAIAKKSIFRDSMFFLAVGAVLFTILFIYLSKVENHIISINNELTEDISKRKQAEEQIKASLREKEVLLKEVHHRVKNNMMIITSLLSLQSKQIEDEQYREMFSISINRIKSMSLIHEKLYRSEDMAKVDFNDYLKDMIKTMFESYGLSSRKVALKTDIEGVTFGIDTAIPCGLIINELISNSLKHSFPGDIQGEIKVALRRNDKTEVKLTVSDNGVGMPEDMDFRNTTSLGLTLVIALVKQLKGEIELYREKGTEFVITFKG